MSFHRSEYRAPRLSGEQSDQLYTERGLSRITRQGTPSSITFDYSALPRDELTHLWKERQLLHFGANVVTPKKSRAMTPNARLAHGLGPQGLGPPPPGTNDLSRSAFKRVPCGYVMKPTKFGDKYSNKHGDPVYQFHSMGNRGQAHHVADGFPDNPTRHNPWAYMEREKLKHIDNKTPDTTRRGMTPRGIQTPEVPQLCFLTQSQHVAPPASIETLLDAVSVDLMNVGTSLYDLRGSTDLQFDRVLADLGYPLGERDKILRAFRGRYPVKR